MELQGRCEEVECADGEWYPAWLSRPRKEGPAWPLSYFPDKVRADVAAPTQVMVDRLIVAMADQPVGGGPPIQADEEGYTSTSFCGICGRQHDETRDKMSATPAQQ